jgi:hypothetical protein
MASISPGPENFLKNSRGEMIQKFNNRVYMNSKIDAVLQSRITKSFQKNPTAFKPNELRQSRNAVTAVPSLIRGMSKMSSTDAESDVRKIKIASTFDSQSN